VQEIHNKTLLNDGLTRVYDGGNMNVENLRTILLIVFVSLGVFSATTMGQVYRHTAKESQAISYTKSTLVSRIEKGLPNTRFDAWLKKLGGRRTKIAWEVNDCGEQTGTAADRGRDFPMCVEAHAQSGEMAIVIGIMVGTFKKGITGRPIVRLAELHFEGEEHESIDKLVDFAAAIRKATGNP